jgi:hypothetical protein
MEKSEGLYLIRDVDWRRGQSTTSIGTGEGKGDNRRRRLERERQTLETLIQFVKFVGKKGQSRSDWNNRLRRLGG